jgi:hypothetical protein
MKKKYRAVILLDPVDIREAFSKAEFTGRFGYQPLLDANHGEFNLGAQF